jgi:ADP-ribose pyrophosphatase
MKKWKKTGSRMLYRGKQLSVAGVEYLLPTGKRHMWEIIKYPDLASVVALKGNKVIMVRQFRPSLGRKTLEIPGGKVDAGEDPEKAAIRELEEETGYRAKEIRKLATINYTRFDCSQYIYLATRLEKGKASPDETELLEIVEVGGDQVMKAVFSGEIAIAASVAGILAAREKGFI